VNLFEILEDVVGVDVEGKGDERENSDGGGGVVSACEDEVLGDVGGDLHCHL
jgi:hypothetical protein